MELIYSRKKKDFVQNYSGDIEDECLVEAWKGYWVDTIRNLEEVFYSD